MEEVEIYYRLEYTIFSPACSILFSWTTRSINRDIWVDIYYRLEYTIFSPACSIVFHWTTRSINRRRCIQEYLKILWLRKTKPSKINKFINFIFLCKKYFFKTCKTLTLNGYATSGVRSQSKTFTRNAAC